MFERSWLSLDIASRLGLLCGVSLDVPTAGMCYPGEEKGGTSWSPLAKNLPDLITPLRD